MKKIVLLALALVLLSIATSVCVVGFLGLRMTYALPYTDITVETAYNMITNGSYPDLVILDVRRQDEYDSGHIYGAVWIPHTELDTRINELADHENHEIIVYCRTGVRSVNASETLDSYNFTKVHNMLGGITAWQSAGYSVWIATVHNINTAFNYDTIQAAIDAPQTLDEHTILVDAGTYYEHVVVNKSILLIGENKETTVIDGNSTGTIVHVTANNTNISDFTIQNSGYGIFLVDSSDNNISGNIIKNNQIGIFLISSSSNALTDSIVSHNEYGIILDKSSNNNNLADNTVLNNYIGIRLIDSYNNILMGNIASENTGGIELRSDTKLFSGNNTLVGNIASNNIGYGIQLFLSSNNTLVGNNVSYGAYGMYLLFSRNNTLSGNIASNNEYNFYVDGSILDDFKNYVDISNTVDGKPIYYLTEVTDTVYDFQTNAGTIYVINADNVTVTNLTLTKNGYGILLWNITNSKIENITTSNNEVGIRFYFSNNNTVISNNVSNNQCGIRLLDSASNIFSQNTLSNNDLGMKLWGSIDNMIHHNNFINNTNQVDLSESSNNLWDDGYPSGGNYWSDYEERYPDAQEIDGTGIWDTPYVIDENNQDNYPLVPEFPTWTPMLLILIGLTVAMAIYKRRLLKISKH